MFKHSCFIENSKEAREHLDQLGYKPNKKNVEREGYLVTIHEEGEYYLVWHLSSLQKTPTDYETDCIGNLPFSKHSQQ